MYFVLPLDGEVTFTSNLFFLHTFYRLDFAVADTLVWTTPAFSAIDRNRRDVREATDASTQGSFLFWAVTITECSSDSSILSRNTALWSK